MESSVNSEIVFYSLSFSVQSYSFHVVTFAVASFVQPKSSYVPCVAIPLSSTFNSLKSNIQKNDTDIVRPSSTHLLCHLHPTIIGKCGYFDVNDVSTPNKQHPSHFIG